MFGFFGTWLDSICLACEVQVVISVRLVYLMQGGPHAVAEANRMVSEKLEAFADAQAALINALVSGEGLPIAVQRSCASVRARQQSPPPECGPSV